MYKTKKQWNSLRKNERKNDRKNVIYWEKFNIGPLKLSPEQTNGTGKYTGNKRN